MDCRARLWQPRETSVCKLACVNWPGHLHVMIPEGLNKKPIKAIVSDIANVMGFNCVRLTWATYMYTRYLNVTVSQSLDQWNLTVAKDGIARNNPKMLGLTVVEAQNAVIDELAKEDITSKITRALLRALIFRALLRD
ncbi:ricin B, lectin domain, glycoside hydrolase, partial [Tanacetum coccineum]